MQAMSSYKSIVTGESSTLDWSELGPLGFDFENDSTREVPAAELEQYLLSLVEVRQ
jgi:hypothetical protein